MIMITAIIGNRDFVRKIRDSDRANVDTAAHGRTLHIDYVQCFYLTCADVVNFAFYLTAYESLLTFYTFTMARFRPEALFTNARLDAFFYC